MHETSQPSPSAARPEAACEVVASGSALNMQARVNAATSALERDMAVYSRGGLFDETAPSPPEAASLRPGDILLRVVAHAGSLGVAMTMLSGYAHCGIVVQRSDALEVVDCHPEATSGGTRSVPLQDWLGDEDDPVLQWLAVRHPHIASMPAERIAEALDIDLRYRLTTDNRQDLQGEDEPENGNCSTLVLLALRRLGVDCSSAIRFGDLNHRSFQTFVELARDGFYRCIAPSMERRILEISEQFDMVNHIVWDGLIVPAAFVEMLPGFDIVAYGRPREPRQKGFSIWLRLYRRVAPALRCAVRYEGLPAGLIPPRALELGGPAFARAVRKLPAEETIDSGRLLHALMQAEIRRPAFYFYSLASVYLTLEARTAPKRLFGRVLLACAGPALSTAQALGWKPLRRFRSENQW